MDKMSKDFTIKKAIARLEKEYPSGVKLIYADYNDVIEDKDQLEEIANTGELCLDDLSLYNMEDESIEYLISENFSEIEREVISQTDELYDAIRDWCFEHDTSSYIEDVIKNTGASYFFYDLNYEVDADGVEPMEVQKALMIERYLNLPETDRPQVRELVNNAYFGGNLAILFCATPYDLMRSQPYIKFSTYYLCVMDRTQGSGWLVELKTPLKLEFVRGNLHHDVGCSGYSFSGEVCGLPRHDSVWTFTSNSEDAVIIQANKEAEARINLDKGYEKTFKEGGCTKGDVSFKRHHNVEYINDFPCGNRCKDCGQFWID